MVTFTAWVNFFSTEYLCGVKHTSIWAGKIFFQQNFHGIPITVLNFG